MNTAATIWPNRNGTPYYIPKNSRVPFSFFTMHRRTDLWGLDGMSSLEISFLAPPLIPSGKLALEFDPDRFLDERQQKYFVNNPFIFLPFNAGPRICLGQQFAYNEASFFIVRLLQEFDSIALVPDAIPIESRPPSEWAEEDKKMGIQRHERVRLKTHLTMHIQVRSLFYSTPILTPLAGWSLGYYA